MRKKKVPASVNAHESGAANKTESIIASGIHSRRTRGNPTTDWKGEMKVLSVRGAAGELHSAVQILSHSDTLPIPAAELFPIRIARLSHRYATLAEIRMVVPNRPTGDRYQFDTFNADVETVDLLLEALRNTRERGFEAVVCCTDKKSARLYQRRLGFTVFANSKNNSTGEECVLIMLPLVNGELKERASQVSSLKTLLKAV